MMSILFDIALLALIFAEQSNAQTAVSSAVFDNLVKYTAFSAAAYGETCASPAYGAVVVGYYTGGETETKATLFRDDAAKEIIIAFKGTSTPADLDRDLEATLVALTLPGISCSSCLVHEGFQSGYADLDSAVVSAVNSQLAANSGYTVIVTGHSLGGGLAALATPSFIGQGIPVAQTYTFGEPRNGNPAWANYSNSVVPTANYFRVTHSNDGVPQIPPTVLDYEHHGQEYWEAEIGNNNASTTFACARDSLKCNAGQSYGTNPISLAHITYSNAVIGSPLFIAACGAVFPS